MAMNNLPHIIFSEEQERFDYTTPRKGRGRSNFPSRNKFDHGAFISRKLAEVRQKYDENSAIGISHLDTIVLEFNSSPDFDLKTQSLEDMRYGIRLLNIREEKNTEDKTIIRATVSIPKDKINKFVNKIDEYNQTVSSETKTKNEELVNSIEDIKLAILQSFWSDNISLIPEEGASDWCEIWLLDQNTEPSIENQFFQFCARNNIEYREDEILSFPERKIVLVKADRAILTNIINSFTGIAEIRLSKTPTRFWLDLDNRNQIEWGLDLLSRLNINNDSPISVAVIDTGVNNGHQLLAPVITDEECFAVKETLNKNDRDGHGTLMCGLVSYGDLQKCLESTNSIDIVHHIESVKIINSSGTENEKHLYGYYTEQASLIPEIKFSERKRILCLAITSDEENLTGQPSSWSAAIDKISSAADEEVSEHRLFVISAGNIDNNEIYKLYPTGNLHMPIQDPAQAWNALTVGAYTEKTTITEEIFEGYKALAPSGGLSPYSRTSFDWDKKWPIKPDVVFEGGNLAKKESKIDSPCDLSILSTSKDIQTKTFDVINATSCATAKASWFCAQLFAQYPNFSPETIRGLVVHSAEWNDVMRSQFWDESKPNKENYRTLLKVFGYGVPNLSSALYSAKNSLTLIAEEEMSPYFRESSSKPKTKDMHILELPWPEETLLSLPPETTLKLKVTLSYFIEPAPGQLAWKERYRYQSHALRFALNLPGDDKETFKKKLNAASRAEDESIPSSSDDRWEYGVNNRNVGSIHSDVIKNISAAELATTRYIGVYPVTGWWKERQNLGKYNNTARYSLIVSVETPSEEIDLYTPIKVALRQPITIS